MSTTNRYVRRSKISEAKFRELVRYFSLDLDAHKIHLVQRTLQRHEGLMLCAQVLDAPIVQASVVDHHAVHFATLDPAVVVTETVEVTPTATLAPTATQAPTATASGPTPTSEPLPTSTEYTRDAYETNYKDYIDYLASEVGITADDLQWIIEMRLYQDAVYEIITADVEEYQDQVWARRIVVADEAAAQAVLTRLENGEDFAALAQELSQDINTNTKGGDMGWFGLGTQETELEKVAFNLNIGQTSEPVQTTLGWEIIQVLGHEVRQLTNDELNQARSSVFEIWLDQQRDQRDVQVFDVWTDRVPLEPTLPPLTQR